MNPTDKQKIEVAKQAAIDVLLHNVQGPYHGLPRTAGWGYPEPYTRDLMFSLLGIAISENTELLESIRKVLATLAKNQTEHGHIPSLAHDREDRGASDTTPLFLLAVGIFRKVTTEQDFLQDAVQKSLTWMAYQSPSDRYMVAQQPTSDWRDEQWVMGYGLYVNTITYSYLRLLGQHEQANNVRAEMTRFIITDEVQRQHILEGLAIRDKPYFAFWSYKIYSSERFDLLGNSLAILTGIASLTKAQKMIAWIEAECLSMRENGDLTLDLPPNFFPFVKPEEPDWHQRYKKFNTPGEYHNGGIWPFIGGFYVAALVAAKKYQLAEEKLLALTEIIRVAKDKSLDFGFNEWLKAQDGQPKGQNWQTWSAALYLYAVKCVEEKSTPYFDEIRTNPIESKIIFVPR